LYSRGAAVQLGGDGIVGQAFGDHPNYGEIALTQFRWCVTAEKVVVISRPRLPRRPLWVTPYSLTCRPRYWWPVDVFVKTHNIVIREALNRYAGTETKHTGDGILASFASVSQALECAMAIQRAFDARNLNAPAPPIHVRVGLSAGEPVSDHKDLFGASVNLAVRVCATAQPGQILVSNVIRELCLGKPFVFSDIGDVELKGFSPAVRLHEVRWSE